MEAIEYSDHYGFCKVAKKVYVPLEKGRAAVVITLERVGFACKGCQVADV